MPCIAWLVSSSSHFHKTQLGHSPSLLLPSVETENLVAGDRIKMNKELLTVIFGTIQGFTGPSRTGRRVKASFVTDRFNSLNDWCIHWRGQSNQPAICCWSLNENISVEKVTKSVKVFSRSYLISSLELRGIFSPSAGEQGREVMSPGEDPCY